jgi:hypothetical protein
MKIMYRSLGLVAVLALSTLLHSCNKVKDAISINIPTQTVTADFTIDPQPVGTQQLAAFQFGINLDSLIKIQNSSLGLGNIKSAKVKSITLTLSNATQADNFAVVSACEAGLTSNSNNTYKVFASLTNNPDAFSTTLDIPVNQDVDLKDYFNATAFYYKVSATTRRATSTTLQAKATVKLDVTVGL